MTQRSYLKMTGKTQQDFKGECTRKGREGWMEVQFSFESEFPVDPNSGKPKGSRHRKPVTFTKEHGSASNNLLQSHFQLENIETAIHEICARGEDGKGEIVVARFTYEDAYVRRYKGYPSEADSQRSDPRHLEDFELSYRSVRYENLVSKNGTDDDWDKPNAK